MSRCRECGCGEGSACLLPTGHGHTICVWVEPDLCSACILDVAAIVGYPRTAHLWRHAIGTRRAAVPAPVEGSEQEEHKDGAAGGNER